MAAGTRWLARGPRGRADLLGRFGRDRVLERAVAVRGELGLGGRRDRLGDGVQPALELAEHDSEQQVPDDGLAEGLVIACELGELLAPWV